MILPTDITASQPDINASAINPGSISSSAWDLGDNLTMFLSYFTFGIYNPSGMPSQLFVILSMINSLLLILLVYVVLIGARGGGGV